MGVTGLRLAFAILTALVLCAPAQAQRTSYNGIADCGSAANVQFARRDRSFQRFTIDRASVSEDRYAGMVGHQYIPVVYSGSATYESTVGARKVLFVCLHRGSDRGAAFVYTLPR